MNINVLEANMALILSALPDQEVLHSTLFIKGGDSDYILEEDHEDIERVFLDSEIDEVANSGHWVHAEASEEFLEKTLTFLLR